MKTELCLLLEIIKQKQEQTFLNLKNENFLFKTSKEVFKYIRDYYVKYNNLPEQDVLLLHFDKEIFNELPKITDVNFLYQYVLNRYRKNYYYEHLYDIINNSDFEEVLIKNQELLLQLTTIKDDSNEFDFSTFEEDEHTILYPLGLGTFDNVLGGMANSELLLFGGYRGSGKSLILLNIALNNFLLNHETTLFFSIEMRGQEVRNRLDSIITGIDGLRIKKNQISEHEKILIIKKRAEIFKEADSSFFNINSLKELKKAYNNLPNKKHRLILLDTPKLSISKIIYYLKKYPNTGMLIVDYLNILYTAGASESQINWQVQLEKSNELKSIAREFNIKVVSAIQTDENQQIRFSKGIADSLDYFFPFIKDENKLFFSTGKIRNGIPISFSMRLDGLKLIPNEE